VVDTLTYRLTMHEPWAAFPALLAGQGGYVVSPLQLASKEGHSNPIGTGPFKLRSWKTDERFDLIRNPSYWRTGLPRLDGVEFVVIDEGRTRLEMIHQGTMDATAVTRRNDVAELDEMLARANPGLVASDDTSDAEKDTITFNASKAPFNDVRVRRAIAYATDVRALAVTHGWPLDRIAPGLLAPDSPFHTPTSYLEPNVERARALVREYLADPKVKDRPKELVFNLTGSDLNASWLQDLVGQWARAGIQARINLVPAKQLVRYAVVGNFDVAVIRYFAAQDPDVLWHFFVSDTVSDTGISVNFAHFRSDALTAGFNEGRATLDPARRTRAYAQVEKVLAEQVPYFWLNRLEWRMVAAPKVRDARNVTLPDGSPALPYLAGTYRLTETWIAA
jgi:ABC-type transport system substrate-binding protein